VVHGWPTLEGNVVELLPELDRRYPHTTYWLVDGDPAVGRRHVERHRLRRIEVVPKQGLYAVWLALTAEVTFFTHGFFTAVRPPSTRLVVNLWHGDGPKATTHVEGVSSTVAVTGARLWQQYKADTFGLRVEDVAWTGNPRNDALLRGMSTDQWERLGLDPTEALVVWLPTYRVGRNAGGLLWEDGEPLSRRGDLRDLGRAVSREGLSLILKPHPMDRDDYTDLGIRVVENSDLEAADVALYELLGSSSAMISDTSSAWVDFLGLDRPIAFFMPDADELATKRGFNVPDLLGILPGPVLRDVRDLQEFLEAVNRDPADPALLHKDRRARIGPAPLGEFSNRLLDWLDHYQVARRKRPMFSDGSSVRTEDHRRTTEDRRRTDGPSEPTGSPDPSSRTRHPHRD
jgi:hypothetical protein